MMRLTSSLAASRMALTVAIVASSATVSPMPIDMPFFGFFVVLFFGVLFLVFFWGGWVFVRGLRGRFWGV